MTSNIRQAVILAAGQGTRLRRDDQDYPKPLYPLRGRPLIGWAMRALHQAGVEEMFVVVGFAREETVPGIQAACPKGLRLDFVDNPEWKKSNGVSLYQARGKLDGRFFLSMSDHLYAAQMVRTLAAGAIQEDSLYLAVDRKLGSIFDMDDATKVRTRDGRIVDIGKQLLEFDAVDTGLFVCPPAVFSFLESAMVNGDCSLSDAVRAMAREGRARVVDIGDLFWQDVDTPAMLGHAEEWLAAQPARD
ncbi:MAG: NTP transferase domain-containing protein [Myxococcales bacterium]|nr:NTP transferase domain-containing protein [Myxococcales bacterium]